MPPHDQHQPSRSGWHFGCPNSSALTHGGHVDHPLLKLTRFLSLWPPSSLPGRSSSSSGSVRSVPSRRSCSMTGASPGRLPSTRMSATEMVSPIHGWASPSIITSKRTPSTSSAITDQPLCEFSETLMLLQGFHLRSAFLIWWPDNRGLDWRTRCSADLPHDERRVPTHRVQL